MNNNQINIDAYKLADLTFNVVTNYLTKEEIIAEKHGVKHSEYRCLRAFGEYEVINNKELSRRLHLSPSRLTRIADSLVRKGFLAKTIDVKDKRYHYFELKEKGKALYKEVNKVYVKIHREILSNIDYRQHDCLMSAMDSYLKALEHWSDIS